MLVPILVPLDFGEGTESRNLERQKWEIVKRKAYVGEAAPCRKQRHKLPKTGQPIVGFFNVGNASNPSKTSCLFLDDWMLFMRKTNVNTIKRSNETSIESSLLYKVVYIEHLRQKN